MTMEVHKQCAVCAWRETCVKKHNIKESARNCPDYTRDERLPEQPREAAPAERHKRTEDVFGGGR